MSAEWQLRLATLDDEPLLAALFYRCSLLAEGRGDGAAIWPQPAYVLAAIGARIERKETWLAQLQPGAPPIATITLQREDSLVWGDTDGRALYVHGLAVERCMAGRKIGAALLDWATEQGRAVGYSLLRLDCDARNERLQAYYQNHGFCARGVRTLGSYRAALFERKIDDAR